MLMGGVARSLQIAGALESMLDISVRYSNERVAFEKKISKFQAVQHNLAKLAGESAAALAAATSAADTIANTKTFDDAVFLEAAAAKIRCSEAAEKGARLPTRCMARSASPSSTSCIAIACARWHGAMISAPKATGPWNSASWSPRAVPTNYGRWWRRAELHEIRLHESRN